MELLTGKPKDDFEKWISKNVFMVYHGCPQFILNSIIIEWLDTVGLNIGIEPLIDSSTRVFVLGYDNLHHWIDNRFD